MKKVSMKIALAALLIVAGTAGLSAQNGFGGGNRGNGTGTCINNAVLTAEQKAQLTELQLTHQTEMTALRNQLYATTNLADKLAIREQMNALRSAHQAEVKALLESWGITVNQGGGNGGGRRLGGRFGNGTGICMGSGTGFQARRGRR